MLNKQNRRPTIPSTPSAIHHWVVLMFYLRYSNFIKLLGINQHRKPRQHFLHVFYILYTVRHHISFDEISEQRKTLMFTASTEVPTFRMKMISTHR